MRNELCRHIIIESGNTIFLYNKYNGKWLKSVYSCYFEPEEKDFSTSGFEAYRLFYDYAGKDEVEKMKSYYNEINIWESFEQFHYYNLEYANEVINNKVYVYDVNSSFTYGALQLPDCFFKLKEYLMILYDKKKLAENKALRARYKNLQNYLIGYFSRVKKLIAVRSQIISKSNSNVKQFIIKIKRKRGKVFLSNTDSITTDEIGRTVLDEYIGSGVGELKLEKTANKFFYKSSNCYQLDDKVIFSGVKTFARKNTDLINGFSAKQYGELIKSYDYELTEKSGGIRLCKVDFSEIKVDIYNILFEKVETKIYKLKGESYEIYRQ